MQCIEYFQRLESEGKGWELESRSREELENIEEGNGGGSLYAKRLIILNNLYGVDIDEGAVEICKLRLWLSMVADIEDEPGEVEPLPNIDFNIRHGSSLIGFTGIIETVNEAGDTSLTNYGVGEETPVSEYYEDVIHAQRKHKEANSSREATSARRQAESLITNYSEELDDKVLDEFHDAGADITLSEVQEFHPFHWILEFALVYEQGGFDLIIGNPPWDQLRASRDDYFVKFDEQFRSRMPSDKDEMQEELLEDQEIAEGWEEYQEQIEKQMRYFTDGSEYTLQTPVIDGRKDPNENNLAALFFERVFDVVSDTGYVAQVLPGVIFSGSFSKDLRMKLLDDAEIKTLVGFENRGIFEAIDTRYQFAVLTFKNNGETDQIAGVFDQHYVSVLRHFDEKAINIPREVLSQYSLKARIFPNITHPEEVGILESIISHPPLGKKFEDEWNVTPHRELDRSRASDRFVEEESEGDYPVYGGANIHQFQYDNSFDSSLDSPSLFSVSENQTEKSAKYRVRERAYNSGTPKKDIYEAFAAPKTSKSQKGFVNDLLQEHRGKDLCMDDALPDFTEYRIIYRDIARPTDERTMISTVLPKGIVCVHTLQTFSPYEVNPEQDYLSEYPLRSIYDRAYDDEELFVITGLMNSIPFDYLMRTKVDSHIVRFKLEESQMPRLTEEDDWFHYISERAARLNCYGKHFAEMRKRLGGIEPTTNESERRQIQAEIDAAAFHAYGLDRDETKFVLDDFHRVGNPRIMTEDYFDLVLKKFDALKEKGPQP